MQISEDYQKMLLEPNFANIATINPDGSPQLSPIWIDYDTKTNEILVNTAKGRKKDRNMKKNAKIALTVMDRNNPYHYLGVQGIVRSVSEEGARAHINKLAKKYMGKDEYPVYEGEVRILIRIEPKYVHFMG